MNDLLRYQGLYGEQQLPLVTDFIHIEPLADRSKIYEWEIEEHIHTDLVQLFIIEAGSGILFSEGKRLELISPCVITVPANVLHGFHFEPHITGDVITLSVSFYDTLLKDKAPIKQQSNLLYCFPFADNTDMFAEFTYWKTKIQKEIFEEAPEKLLALKTYFELLYLELYREKFRNTSDALLSNNRNLAYFQQFQELIRQHAQNLPSIKKFADAMGITQTHLNRVCHSVTRTSALKVVQDFTINEAKKYLLNTSYSIAEVAYFLNFNDPGYFSRLFKKRVGVAPGEFRKG
ncbi:helix-turn-helix domain-containing protein [uncultured Maribacter sp.]|uniref:helix-turn-helix domain-containing protein n=1 Tax=uncultured Maribacter sp. TaxID=431308 RepID=UPI0030DD61E1|tara:strand:- start:496 stop:1365 length:870 start_codon:yes stop_codon:yes gene_type:complete